ncbi:MAG: ATPase, T2SS/T4P/T4SS family [Patescibacteria group bacterium]
MPKLDLAANLVEKGLLTQAQIQILQKEANTRGVNLEDLIIEQSLVAEQELLDLKSQIFGLPVKNFVDDETVPREVLLLIPYESSRHYQMLAFQKDGKALFVGMVHPENSEAQQALKFIAKGLGLDLKIFLISNKDFTRLRQGYTSFGEEVAGSLAVLKKQAEGISRSFGGQRKLINLDEKITEGFEEAPVIKLVSDILKNAVSQKASDIHLEPEKNRFRVRYRIGGDLGSVLFLPEAVQQPVLTRIKIMAEMKIDETRVPQDGRFSSFVSGRQIDFRVSTFPTSGGEKAAIRILDPESGLQNLEDLGFSNWNLEIVKKNLQKPFGMILVTGPTGSGKTTTLYACLQILNQDSVNLVTLEDPVEYFINGVNQSQVIPEIGYTFAFGLRSILRQDPNVIMVGEVRDTETAELATHAALTGHLVLSTLHTNNAISAIPRLLDLGVQKFLIPATINIVIAQRLLRQLCPDCKKPISAPPEIEKMIDQSLAGLPQDLRKQLNYKKPYQIFDYGDSDCQTCKNKRTLGRIGIFEIFQMTQSAERIILSQGKEESLFEEAKVQQMVTLRQEAVLHLLEGKVHLSEVLRETI